MAQMVSLGTLKTKIREQSDMVNSEFITDAELTRYINDSTAELRSLLMTAYGEDYYFARANVVFAAGVDEVSLPADWVKTFKLEIANGTRKTILRRFSMRNEHQSSGNCYRYREMGGKIYLDNIPTSSLTLYLSYIPKYTPMVVDADEFDFVNNWDQYVVADVCLKMLAKQQDDLSYFINKKNEQLDRINKEKIARNLSEPEVMEGFNEFDVDSDWWY